MTWFRVDDGFASHPKVIALQERKGWESSLALWMLGGVHCAQQLTDGAITAAAVKRLGCDPKAAENLVATGLWERTESGWQYHDWADHQPTREAVLSRRAASAERQRKARDKHVSHAVTDAAVTRDATRDKSVSHTTPTRPDPTRPVLGERDHAPPERMTWSDVLKLVNDATGTLHNPSPKNRQACETIAAVQSPEDVRAAAAAMGKDGWARDHGGGPQHFAEHFARYLATARKPPPPDPVPEPQGKTHRQKLRDQRDRSTDPAERQRLTDAIMESQRSDGITA